jgi:hypothetical protein
MQAAGTGDIVHHGTLNANDGVYDIVTAWRVNQPSIEGAGMSTFLQIFSIRQNSGRNRDATSPVSGTIDISAHFAAWESQIPPQTITAGGRTHTGYFSSAAELHEVMFLIEGFGGSEFSSGGGRVDRLCLRYGENAVCTQNGCAHCAYQPPLPTAFVPSPSPSPSPTPQPSPSPSPQPTPSPTPAPPLMRFQVDSTQYTLRGLPDGLEVAPFIDEQTERTMVPFRAIAEGLGAEIHWDEVARAVTFTRGGETARVAIGEPLPGGMGTAEIIDGRTFVPVRYVSEVLGARIRWESATRAVYIYEY